MSGNLNSGTGQCQGTARLAVRTSEAAAEMHAGHDILFKVLNAVHHVNRTGDMDDFIAVALPGMHLSGERRLALPALKDRARSAEKQDRTPRDITDLFGSECALESLIACEGMRRLQAMGAIDVLEIDTPWLESGDAGVAYVRDRSTAKLGPAKLRRMKKRAEKMGRPFVMPSDPVRQDVSLCALHYGSAVVRVRDVSGIVTEGPYRVSTYGFSRPNDPAFLPVAPIVPEVENAA